MEKYFVTTPIYYVNDKPHIGHVYTTIAADTLARWKRKEGARVLFSTGTDENSQKSVEAAEKAGEPVEEFVDTMAGLWQKTFHELGFSHDVFIRTTEERHKQAVRELLKRIEEAGDIYLGDYEGLYCVGCEAFKKENDLVDGKCPDHNREPKEIKEKNYFFKLSGFREKLLAHYEANREFVQPDSARNKMLYYIEHEMEDVSISRQEQQWGIRLPQDEEHAIYVWFDALINYLTVSGFAQNNEDFVRIWPADLHLVGKDIIKFHCAIWPAMLMSAKVALPKQIFAHGFFTIDGQKISKSLGNAIDPLELANKYSFDAVRYFVLRDIPFGKDGDFSQQRLLDRYNADLANGLGNLVSRTLKMIEQYYPDYKGGGETDSEVVNNLNKVDHHLSNLAFDQALAAIWKALRILDELIEKKKPWELAKAGKKDEVEVVLQSLYSGIVLINEKLEPFMPETYKQLQLILITRPIKKPEEPLFVRLNDSII